MIAASSSQGDGIHTSGRVPATGLVEDLACRVRDLVGGEAEVWFAGAKRLELSLIGPTEPSCWVPSSLGIRRKSRMTRASWSSSREVG